MSYLYIYSPVALIEYKDAVGWYYLRSKKAAENFVIAIGRKIENICADPFLYRKTYKNFRETSIKKYPYYLVYFVDETERTVIITSVYHHKRNPQKKYIK